jgi:hypothetical protein
MCAPVRCQRRDLRGRLLGQQRDTLAHQGTLKHIGGAILCRPSRVQAAIDGVEMGVLFGIRCGGKIYESIHRNVCIYTHFKSVSSVREKCCYHMQTFKKIKKCKSSMSYRFLNSHARCAPKLHDRPRVCNRPDPLTILSIYPTHWEETHRIR